MTAFFVRKRLFDVGSKDAPLRILITGFGAFGNVINNPSGRIARRFKRQTIRGADLVTRLFRVSYKQVDRDLPRILKRGRYDVVLLLGIAGNEKGIRLERFAKNRDRAKAADVDRNVRRKRAINSKSQRRFETNAPISELRLLLNRNGIRCRISKDAGGFLCNHAYYVAQDAIDRLGLKVTCLFVHVPPDRVAIRATKAKKTMPLRKQFQAVEQIAEFLCSSASVSDK